QLGRARRCRSRAVLRVRRGVVGRQTTQRAPRVHEGVARAGPDEDGTTHARTSRVRALGRHHPPVGARTGRVQSARRDVFARPAAVDDDHSLTVTTPQLSVGLPNFGGYLDTRDWHQFIDLARAADDAGVDRVVVVDHVVMGPNTDAYAWGNFPTPPEAPWLEPLTVLAAMAAVTT